MTGSLRVSLPVFEGPMDLLLYLVKKDEVEIYDIEIARITEQYLQYLTQMQDLDLEVAGDFLAMAANLIYIKSRSLLPPSEQPPEEDAEDDDPRWDLIRQLIEYKKFKEAATNLQERENFQNNVFHRAEPPPLETEPAIGLGKVGMLDLIQAFQKALENFSKRHNIQEIQDEEFTVGQKIEFILETIRPGAPLRFSRLFGGLASRSEIVVTFLALLELIRLKQLKVRQNSHFADMEICHA
ncbi:MAG: segregation/condensation protein A [bacterium]